MTDQWDFWRRSIAGEMLPIHADQPQSGYYKMRKHKGGPWVPVAMWQKDGSMIALKERRDNRVDPVEIWTYCAGNAVTKEAATLAFDTGQWPGDLELELPDAADAADGDGTARAELERIIDQARTWAKDSPEQEAITKDMADLAANFDDRVMKLEKMAKAERDGEFAPLEAEIKRLHGVQAELRLKKGEWKTLFDAVAPARGVLKNVYVAWQRARSLANEDTKCGGQYANRKSYIAKNDPLHPDTIAAREAAEKAEQDRLEAERRVQEELRHKAEAERRAQVVAEAKRIEAENRKKAEQAPEQIPEPIPEEQRMVPRRAPEPTYSIGNWQDVMAWAVEQDAVIGFIEKYALDCARIDGDVPGIVKVTEDAA